MDSAMSTEALHDELRTRLLASRTEWKGRLEAIRADRSHPGAPLDPDLEEQAIERENDEALDALDTRGRQALEAIDAALSRLASGTFGRCLSCDEPIPAERLRAEPTAGTCLSCATA